MNGLACKSSNITTKDVFDTLSSSVTKTLDFFENYIKNILNGESFRDGNGICFLKSLNDSKITPNNIVSFRLSLLILGVFVYHNMPLLATSIVALSASFDAVDGKLARKYNQKTKAGEIFDPMTDKLTDIILSTLSTIALLPNLPLTILNGIAGIGKTYYHSQSQFKEGRPSPNEQLDISLKAIFKDEQLERIEEITNGAANSYGKYKTILQLVAGIGILLNENTDFLQGNAETILNIILVTTNFVSLILAHKSANSGNGVKETEQKNGI